MHCKSGLPQSCVDTAMGEVIHTAAQPLTLWPWVGPSLCTHLRLVSAQGAYQPRILPSSKQHNSWVLF